VCLYINTGRQAHIVVCEDSSYNEMKLSLFGALDHGSFIVAFIAHSHTFISYALQIYVYELHHQSMCCVYLIRTGASSIAVNNNRA